MIVNYFQSYNNYFWNWEEHMDVISIPNGNTIAYSQQVTPMLNLLASGGLPPFGALLLVIIATNPNGQSDLKGISQLFSNDMYEQKRNYISEALEFLQLLTTVPEPYKKGEKRMLLIQTIFEGCHGILSLKKSKAIFGAFLSRDSILDASISQPLNLDIFDLDFRVISLLGRHFKSPDEIIAKIASIPEIEEKVELEDSESDILKKLMINQDTFKVGALIERIWMGLKIPAQSSLTGPQPIGGVADLTNKGEFDKLLVSEFANDDLVFLSRLANSEALYFNRETPPVDSDHERTLLIDVSIKNWGNPKIMAFAIALAIANHPKNESGCNVFAIGKSYWPVSLESIDTIIDGLQLLDASIDSTEGLRAYFRDYPSGYTQDVFLITESTAFKHAYQNSDLIKYLDAVNYWIYTESKGYIDVYRRQHGGKKHLQRILLPLKELWSNPPKSKAEYHLRKVKGSYPILFRVVKDYQKMLRSPDGEVYRVTSNKKLLRLYNPLEDNVGGWEMLLEDLPFSHGYYEMGINENDEPILLLFDPQSLELTLLNIESLKMISVQFPFWKKVVQRNFIFNESRFWHKNQNGNWSISLEGDVESEESATFYNTASAQIIKKLPRYTNRHNILKNIREVFINKDNALVFNTHKLKLTETDKVKLVNTKIRTRIAEAKAIGDSEFQFSNGSKIEVNRAGMIILKSDGQEDIFIPSVLDATLGLATVNHFTGNEFYFKNAGYKLVLNSTGKSIVKVVKLIMENTDKGLKESKSIVDKLPATIVTFSKKELAEKMKSELEAIGADVETVKVNEEFQERSMGPKEFFETKIDLFLSNILIHETKD